MNSQLLWHNLEILRIRICRLTNIISLPLILQNYYFHFIPETKVCYLQIKIEETFTILPRSLRA
jgi:hypothetical protein